MSEAPFAPHRQSEALHGAGVRRNVDTLIRTDGNDLHKCGEKIIVEYRLGCPLRKVGSDPVNFAPEFGPHPLDIGSRQVVVGLNNDGRHPID